MRYDTVLFDLDGTVSKTDPGVLNSVRYSLGVLGYPFPTDVPERLFMGPPLEFSFREYCHIPDELNAEAVRQYRVYYTDRGIYECELYPGIRELLERLRARGVKLLVASSKPEAFVRRILEKFGADGLFDFIGGADFEGKRSEKPEVIDYTLKMAGVTDVKRALMVGDRKYDILGARDFGMDSCGVLFGYGDCAELTEAGATYIVDNALDIERIVTGD